MDEVTADTQAELIVDNANVPVWQSGLASAVNSTYNYAHNSLYYGLLPNYYRDYAWRYIRPACQWLDGYVTSLHQQSGIISTRIGSKLITGLAKQVIGEKILFKKSSKESDNATLDFVSDWANKNKIYKAIYTGVGYALGVGTSIIKINVTQNQKLWWEAVRLDNCFYQTNFKNEIEDATFIIRGYTDTRKNKNKQQFYLVEHRYYKYYDKPEIINDNGIFRNGHNKGDRVPMVEYKVHRVLGTVFNNLMPRVDEKSTVNWQELPQEIRDAIKRDYRVIRVDEPQLLGFINLGCELFLNGEQDLAVPNCSGFGESLLVGIQSDMITYEVAASYKIRDMYLGKGTVYVPKSLSMSDTLVPGFEARNGVLNGVGEDKYETIKGVSPEEQSIVVQQFNIREQEWQTAMDNALKNIAVKWGMSPKVLASYLATANATATQIDSEDDMSVGFIYHTRSYFKEALDNLIETTLNFYGRPNNITIKFASPSLINKDRLLKRLVEMLTQGLITKEDVIRELYPDADEDEIQRKIAELRTANINGDTNNIATQGAFNGVDNKNIAGNNIVPEMGDLDNKKLVGSTEIN